MSKKICIKYIIYTILIIAYLFINAYITNLIKTSIGKTYSTTPMMLIYSIIKYILFGLLLGVENIIREKRKEGNWKINTKKLLIIGLPILLLVLYPFLYYTFTDIVFPSKLTALIMHKDNTTIKVMSRILLGYIITSSFYKTDNYERRVLRGQLR